MNDEIKTFFEIEREVSNIRLSSLRRREKSAVTNRLIDIEERFLSFDFESLPLKSIKDARRAVKLFRISRTSFNEAFGLENFKNVELGEANSEKKTAVSLNELKEKLSIHSSAILNHKVEALNPVQSKVFFSLLQKNYEKDLSSMDLKELRDLENSKLSKFRARTQAVMESLGLYLEHLSTLNDIDDILNGLKSKKNLFAYYNDSLQTLQNKLNGTMGENKGFQKIHPLVNALDRYPGSGFPFIHSNSFDKLIPQVGFISYGLKQPIYNTLHSDSSKGTRNRSYGILLPFERSGNEKMDLFFKRIIVDDIDITNLFEDNLANVKALDNNNNLTYFKTLMMKPLWVLAEQQLSEEEERVFRKIFDLSDENLNHKSKCKKFAARINNNQPEFVNVNKKQSLVLISKTRSEQAFLESAMKIVEKIANISDLG